MKLVTKISDVKQCISDPRRAGRSVGLVPTMGALHDGHASLMRRSVRENGMTVVSIFVNPTQFGPNENLDNYPRRFERDAELCRTEHVDVVFAPTVGEIYPQGFSTHVEVEKLTKGLCGKSRPGHFRGVVTVCVKLFGIVEPDRAYFGEKDYQQLAVIRRMVADLDMNLEVVACPTVREPDGLALSSRNVYLDADARTQAAVLYRSLVEAKRLVEEAGVRRSLDIIRAMTKTIKTARMAKVDYLAVVHPETLEPLDTIEGEAVIALAVFINKTRLIDNIKVNPSTPRPEGRGLLRVDPERRP